MQSFRERSGFHGNQHCYQQEPHELSRLETYRHHHGQSRQAYEAHSLPAAGMPTAGAGSKDCYGQQTYPSYGSGSSAQAKKPYRGGKAAGQHLQAGYSSHMSSGYSAQYMSEGHLQQKWDESAQMSQYEQDMVGRLESGVAGSSQYLEQNMLAMSQSQCHLPSQASNPAYTSPHQQGHAPNPAPSPLMYPQSQLHFPQHSQPPSSTSSSYMDKCNPVPHGYKSGYGMPSNAQYSRQLGNHSSMKQSGYRPQNSYGYQQPSSRTGFEQQASLQGMPGTPESLQKFQHYNQPQQNYCITDISVRSPEQYYQNCSPSSSHSPARSVGRSPSYSSTPSPLMPNPDSFQYGQAINPTTSSSSSSGLQDQSMLMPPHTHPSPSVNHQSQSYSSSMKERFSEKLLSNPSLWSLNALTSQVENISNNVQQLLLSEALMANKKGSKRNQPKKGEEYRGQVRAMEDSSCPDSQHGPPPTDAYGTPRSIPAELQEGGYSSNTEDQMERSYYYFGQGKGTAQVSTHSQLSLDTVSTCSINSTDDMSIRSGDSVRSLQSAASEDNLSCDPRAQRVPFGEEQNSSLRCIRDERSPISVTAPSPMKQESNSPLDIKQSESILKENFEESAWTDRMADEKEIGKKSMRYECKGEVIETAEKQQEWLEEEKCPSLFRKMNKVVSDESYSYDTVDTVYQELKSKYEAEEGDFADKSCDLADTNCKGNEDSEMKPEVLKSEPQTNVECPVTKSPPVSRDILESNQCLPPNEESLDMLHLTSLDDSSEERLSASERPKDSFEEQESVSFHPASEVREEKPGLTPTEEVVNNKGKPEQDVAEACNKLGETAGGPVVSTETKETTVQDTTNRSSERRSAICDIAPQSHSVKPGFSTLNEKTTPQTQARDHIDHSDAKVLEPDSPQLPGKSIMHSAPSWADTPPSPQKGDEDIEPGISCPSAVTPSAKPEPFVPSAHPRLQGRKHARGRRRLLQSNAGIRRQPSMEGDGAPPSPQKPSMPSSNSTLFPDQMGTAQLDISSQTPKLLADGLPSRMCTRSFGSQSSPKVSSQERRKPGSKPGAKPGPKPSSKPGPKPAPKPGLKPGPKPGLKSGLKLSQGSKPGPKPSSKPGPKPGPKPGSKPGPKPGPKPGAVPTVNVPKPVAKTVDIPVLKSGPKSSSKPTKSLIPKGPGRPRGLASKIKSVKHENNAASNTEYIKDTTCISASSEQQQDKAVPLGTVGDTTLGSSTENMGSTLETGLDSTSIKPAAKDQKSMVLRSRKQAQAKLTEGKEKDNETLAETPVIKLIDKQIKEAAAPQTCNNQTLNLKSPTSEDVCTESLSQSNEEIVSVSIKRKSSLQYPNPVKKKKGVKLSQTKIHEPTLKTAKGGNSSKGKRKRGNKLEPSKCSLLTKENPPPEDITDTPCVPPQCPTKTKYLPPRKGRGLKYEAMVQKITSPASKKQPQTVQPDALPEEFKSAQETQVTEKTEIINTPGVAPEDGESTVSFEETPDIGCIQTPRKKRRKWSTVEITDVPDIVPEAESLIINTPRLAKQRAIKNNHEMHLKQQKKRRKCAELGSSASVMEEQEQNQTELPIPPPPPPPSPPPPPQIPSTTYPETGEQTQSEHPHDGICSIIIKPKRGRRPSLKKKQQEASGACAEKDEIQKVKKKPGPKKKVQQGATEATSQAPKLKAKRRKDRVPTVKAKLSDFLKPQGSESKCSFRPYVRIDSSREIASHCTIVNRPEEEQLLIQSRKRTLVKIKNPVTVAKVIPNSSVMLQGPLVNRSLTDRCLACCLCGKPANYRELGDLCGPYYPEDGVPRKTLSLMHQEDFRQNRDRDKGTAASCSAELSDTLRKDGVKDLHQEGTSEGDCGQPRRERRAQLRSRLSLRMRFKRLQLLQSRAGSEAPPAGEEGCGSTLLRLQQEAQSREHWAHEACTVWTGGVILVSGKLYGLREAAQDSTVTKCSKCQHEGASIGCSWKNCTNKYHYICAKETGCVFEEDTFSIKCPKHKAM